MNQNAKHFELLFDRLRNRRSKWRSLLAEKLQIARSALVESQCTRVPIDLAQLARYAGVSDVRVVPLAIRGRIIKDREDLIIESNRDLEPFHKRQTLAHELAHLLIERGDSSALPRASQNRQSYGGSYGSIEKLCDSVAAEILVPLHWIRDQTRGTRPSLNTLAKIAESAKCSHDYIAERIYSEALWECTFLIWQLDGNGLKVIKSFPAEAGEDTHFQQLGSPAVLECFARREYLRVKGTSAASGKPTHNELDCLPLGPHLVLEMIV